MLNSITGSITGYFSNFVKNQHENNLQIVDDYFANLPDEILKLMINSFSLGGLSNFTITCKKFHLLSLDEKFPCCLKLAQSIFKNIYRLPTSCYIEMRHINRYANYFGKINSSEDLGLFCINDTIGIDEDTPLGFHDFRLHRELFDVTDKNRSISIFSFINITRIFKVTSVNLEEINESMPSKSKSSLFLAIKELNAIYLSDLAGPN